MEDFPIFAISFLSKDMHWEKSSSFSIMFCKSVFYKRLVCFFFHEHPVQFAFLSARKLSGLFGGF